VDHYGGLLLVFAPGVSGDAIIYVTATDSSGLSVTTPVKVHVNAAPVISDFGYVKDMGAFYTFSGRVTDADGPVEGLTITLGGVLADFNLTAIVQADGTFSITRELYDLEGGPATAQTQDGQGALSNLAECYVVLG